MEGNGMKHFDALTGGRLSQVIPATGFVVVEFDPAEDRVGDNARQAVGKAFKALGFAYQTKREGNRILDIIDTGEGYRL